MNDLIIPERLSKIEALPLAHGSHGSINEGLCVMEAVAYIAGEPWTDSPACACPVIAAFLRSWNDGLPDDKRQELKQYIPMLVGTRGDDKLAERRSLMAADWLVRTHTPAWLRLAGLNAQADALAGLPEITSMAQVPSIKPAIEAARTDAAAARAAAWDAAGAKLKPTQDELYKSAHILVRRMLEAK